MYIIIYSHEIISLENYITKVAIEILAYETYDSALLGRIEEYVLMAIGRIAPIIKNYSRLYIHYLGHRTGIMLKSESN